MITVEENIRADRYIKVLDIITILNKIQRPRYFDCGDLGIVSIRFCHHWEWEWIEISKEFENDRDKG